jgi:hypothetical protein
VAEVKHVELPDGSHAIGVGAGDAFVPFATLDAARYKQLEENEHYTAGGGKRSKGGGKSDKAEGGAK